MHVSFLDFFRGHQQIGQRAFYIPDMAIFIPRLAISFYGGTMSHIQVKPPFLRRVTNPDTQKRRDGHEQLLTKRGYVVLMVLKKSLHSL